jgi:bifunctional non-homologous end joining protein LigD
MMARPFPTLFGIAAAPRICAFDLLELDGRDLRGLPLGERRRLLARLIRKPRAGLVLNEQYDHDGPTLFEHACKLGCEGIVSKRQNSRYHSGRSHAIG